MKDYNFGLVKTVPRLGIKLTDYKNVATPDYIKNIRTLNNLTQKEFSRILHVEEGVLKDWENGSKNISGSYLVLIYLLGQNSELIKQLYSIRILESKIEGYNENAKYKQGIE
jgi:DNA-binding transcriptional regulator YiaG